jgi:hypothetical protein
VDHIYYTNRPLDSCPPCIDRFFPNLHKSRVNVGVSVYLFRTADPYAVPKEMGIFTTIDSASSLTTAVLRKRIVDNYLAFQSRQKVQVCEFTIHKPRAWKYHITRACVFVSGLESKGGDVLRGQGEEARYHHGRQRGMISFRHKLVACTRTRHTSYLFDDIHTYNVIHSYKHTLHLSTAAVATLRLVRS